MKTTKFYAVPDKDGLPTKPFTDSRCVSEDRVFVIMDGREHSKLMRIVRMDAKKGCTRLVQRADKDNPMVIGFYDCGKCAPCLARKLLKGAK